MTPIDPPHLRPASRRRVRTLWIAVGVTAALVLGGGVALALRDSTPTPAPAAAPTSSPASHEPTPTVLPMMVITLEPSGDSGLDPFTDRRVTDATTFPREVTAVAVDPAGLSPDAATGTLLISGDTEALYGGSPAGSTALYGGSNEQDVCDTDELIAFLAGNPDKAAAWAGVHGLDPANVEAYLRTLTPVVLTADTAVTNHGFAGGRAVARQSVLQAGTAVLVDPFGVPAVRCACGNPLLPPKVTDLPGADFTGTRWAAFDPSRVLAVRAAGQVQTSFTLVDVTSGAALVRAAGADGPGLLVAASAAGVSTSPDGATWTLAPGSPATDDVEYGGERLVALAHSGDHPDIITTVHTSTDGTAWTQTAQIAADLTELTYDGTRWIAAGSAPTTRADADDESVTLLVATSTDAMTWDRSESVVPTEWPGDSLVLSGLATQGQTWLVDLSGFLGDGPVQSVARSADAGATWSTLDWSAGLGVRWAWTGAGWGAAANQAEMIGLDEGYLPHARGGTSVDGVDWTFAPAAPDALGFLSLTWDADRRWIAVGESTLTGTDVMSEVYASADLLTWTELGDPDADALDVAVLPGTLPAGYQPPVPAPAPAAAPSSAPAPAPVPVPAPAPAPAPAPETCLLQSENGEQAWAETYPGVPMACEAMIARWRSYETWPGEVQGMVAGVDFGDGWSCSTGWVPNSTPEYYDGSLGDCWTGERADGVEGFTVWRGAYGQRLKFDGTPAPFDRAAPASAPAPDAPAPDEEAPAPGGGADISVSKPASDPACDGTPIVIYESAVTPGRYAQDVQAMLDRHPGASWVRTDQSCSSFSPRTQAGDPIYAVYQKFSTETAACAEVAAVIAAGSSPGTRYLADGSPASSEFSCS